MEYYHFMKGDNLSEQDAKRLIALTESGVLLWMREPREVAYSAKPAFAVCVENPTESEKIIGKNLRGIKAYFETRLSDNYQKSWTHYEITTEFGMTIVSRLTTTAKVHPLLDRLFALIQEKVENQNG